MKKIWILFVAGVLMQACLYEDKGNYDYTYLPEFMITGVENDYGNILLAQDTLKIYPEIVFTGEDDEVYEYTWYRKVNGEKLVPIGKEKILNFMPDDIGNYQLRFHVKHKPTGLTCWTDTKCYVRSETERGFYVLKQTKEGNTELDAFWQDDEGEYTTFQNVLTDFVKIGALEGRPLTLDYNKYRYDNQEKDTLEVRNALFIATPEDIAILDLASLKHIASYEDLFSESMPPRGERNICGFYSLGQTSALIYGGEDGKNKINT